MTETIVIGEALVDIVETAAGASETPGGSPANVALVLGRLGHSVTLRTALGDDEHGHAVRAWLAASNVKVEATPLDRTSTARARLSITGAAEYEFDLNWTLDDVPLAASRVVHTGSIGAWHPPGTWRVEALLERARPSSTISFDPNIRPTLIRNPAETRKRVARLAGLADIIKLSDEDLQWLYPDETEAQAVAGWCNGGAAFVVVTHGESGATAYSDHYTFHVPGTPTTVQDTIGAGDTFMGTMLATLADRDLLGAEHRETLRQISESDLRAILQRSAAAASITVSRRGANPPWASELAARI